MSSTEGDNITSDNNSDNESPQKEDDKDLSETDEEEEDIIKRFGGLLKPAGMFCPICNKCIDAKTSNSLQRHIKRYHPKVVNKEGSSDVYTFPTPSKRSSVVRYVKRTISSRGRLIYWPVFHSPMVMIILSNTSC